MPKYFTRIAAVLESKDISQRQFAKNLDVPYTTFSSWLRGVCDPPMEILLKTANLLNISIDEDIFERATLNQEKYILPNEINNLIEAKDFLSRMHIIIKDLSDQEILQFAKMNLLLITQSPNKK